ncbi:AAA family ATPase [Escherichia coli]|uniref:AAA family ATPase n=1 Tax=Escherichia coli TaxID=562 RepID=UPI001E41FE37|nr:AAA family ATPase [Escherichia coli]
MNGTHTEMHIDWCATPDYRYIIAIDNSVAANYGEWSELDGINDDLCDIELAEIQLQSEKRLRPVIENLFNRKQVGFLYGESNTGKSFAALSLLNRVAQGKPWAGLRVAKECHAFYFDGETGVEIKDRNTAWCNKFNSGVKNDRMHILSPQINLFDKEIQRRIINDVNKITNNKGGIICFDTLSSFLAYYTKKSIDGTTTLDMENPDENDAIAMRKLISILKRIAVETNSFVLMVHHGGKDAAKGMKGAITLKNDSDTVIKLEQIQGNDFGLSVSLTIEKNRSAAKLPVMQFDLCAVDNGITASELHEIDNELCDFPDENEKGYQVNTSTKTLVFVDKPMPVIAAGKIERKQTDDELFVMQPSPKNEYAQMHMQQRQPVTQQKMHDSIKINQSDGEKRDAAKEFTELARANNSNNYYMHTRTLNKLKNSPTQCELYEKIYNEIGGSMYSKTINLSIFIDNETIASGKRKDVIKKALTEMVRKNVIAIDNKAISLPKPPAQIMTT